MSGWALAGVLLLVWTLGLGFGFMLASVLAASALNTYREENPPR